jgi:predicted nucleic-acid-binding protein
MIGIDSNILVRLLVEDDPHQVNQVHRLLARTRNQGERVWVSAIVLCETLWVLRSAYRSPKARIVEVVDQLLSADAFEMEEGDSVQAALDLYRNGRAEFSDYLIGQLNFARGCRTTFTFDRSLRVAPGFTRL